VSRYDLLAPLLACPACGGPLDVVGAGAACRGCGLQFPVIGGLAWLFVEPQAALADWRGRLRLLEQHLEREAALHRAGLSLAGLHPLTRLRLEAQAGALEAHSRLVQALLEPLGLTGREERHEVHLALGTRLPLSQGLTNYYANLHRDWAWGDQENAASLAEVLAVLAPGGAPSRLLVLGAGGGRLAYDLHQSLPLEVTLALDFNPLLATVGQRVSAGEKLDLFEFPIAPRSLAEHGLRRTLAAPAPSRPGLEFVLGDALAAPFADGTFDAVLTPWFVDIVPDDLPALMARINRLIAPGGRWVFFGSLAWADRPPERCYSLEELLALAPAAGFEAGPPRETPLPYMRSPASRHARIEAVVSFAARKVAEVERPAPPVRPDWLERTDLPVPALPAFREQSLSTRVYAFIMAMIDGKRSIRDMARLMEEQRLMTSADAEPAIQGFLARMHEDAQRRANF
jgi:SAM-dependent methyltransferase